MSEVIKEQGGYRVIIETDPFMYEPESDGQSPLLRIDHGRAEHILLGSRPTEDDERIAEAAERWGVTPQLTKYLTAYYGVTQVVMYYSGSYWYVTYDSAKWRAHVGAPEGSASLSDYKAWCEGEVYICTVQRRVVWVPKTADFPYAERVTWETIHSEGTFYGYDNAIEAANEVFEEYTPSETLDPNHRLYVHPDNRIA
jgi:hypothetical protein